jgi:hypothetical protein
MELNCGYLQCQNTGTTFDGSAAVLAGKSNAIFTIFGYPRDFEKLILVPS